MYSVYFILAPELTKYFYVGMTCKSLSTRMAQHRHAAKIGKKSPLYDCMRKHGIGNFLINGVRFYDTKEECCKSELEMIAHFRREGLPLLNLANGGEGGYVVPESNFKSWIAKLSIARQGRKPALGMKHTEETKKLCGEYSKLRWDKYGRYPEEVITCSYKEAKEKFNISKTHYYRLLKRTKRNDLS